MKRFLHTLALLIAHSALLSAATIQFPADYDHLQRAVNAAAPGDTILIAPGTYEASLTITKSLNIIGSGKGKTILRPAPERNSLIRFTLSPEDNAAFTLKDLTIQHNPDIDGNGELLFVMGAAPLIIENVHVDNSPAYGGIYIEDSLLQARQFSVVTKSSPALNLNSLKEGSTITDLRLTMTSKDYGVDDALWLHNDCQVELSNIKFQTQGTASLAQVTGNLSRVTVTDSSIPAERITYMEGARAEGPTPELVKIMAEEAQFTMNYGGQGGPGEDADFLAKLEPKRRELARELQQSLNADSSQAATQAALVKYISGLISDIEYGPRDYTADPAIHAELKRFEQTFGSEATVQLVKQLPAHPETMSYAAGSDYYSMFLSPTSSAILDKETQQANLAIALDLIRKKITDWPTHPDTVPSAKGFFSSIQQLQWDLEKIQFPGDYTAAQQTISEAAHQAIAVRLNDFDIEVIREMKANSRKSGIKLLSLDTFTDLIENAKGEELQETALAETRINANDNGVIEQIWKSPDGRYMITSSYSGTFLYDAEKMLRLMAILDRNDQPVRLYNPPVYQAHTNRVLLPLQNSIAIFDLDRRQIVSGSSTNGRPLAYYSAASKSSYALSNPYGRYQFVKMDPSDGPEYSTPADKEKTLSPALIHEFPSGGTVVQFHDNRFESAYLATFDFDQDKSLQQSDLDLGRLVSISDGKLLAIQDTGKTSQSGQKSYSILELSHLALAPELTATKTLEVKLPQSSTVYSALYRVTTHAPSQQMVIDNPDALCVINYDSGVVNRVIAPHTLGENVNIAATWFEDAEKLLVSYTAQETDGHRLSHFVRIDLTTGQVIADLSKPGHYPRQLFADSEQSDLYTLNAVGTLKRVRLNPNGFTVKTVQKTASAFNIHSESGLIAYANHGLNTVFLTDRESILDGQDAIEIDSSAPSATIDTLAFSEDGSLLGVRTQQKFYAVSVDSGEVIFETTFSRAHAKRTEKSFAFSPDGSIAIVSQYKAYKSESGYGIDKWMAFDLETGQQLWDFPASEQNAIGFDPSGTSLRLGYTSLREMDLRSGKVIKDSAANHLNYGNALASSVQTTDGSQLAAALGGNEIMVADPHFEKNGAIFRQQIKLKSDGASTTSLQFLADTNFLAATDLDGFIRIWNVETQQLVAKVALFENDAEWAITTLDNRFDIAPGTDGLIYFVAGKEILLPDALYETYYTPKLLPQLLTGSQLEAVPEVTNQITPPRVTLGLAAGSRGLFVEDDDALEETDVATVRLRAEAASLNSTIDEIRLYHNGKLITTATRGLFVEDDETLADQAKTKEYTVNLLPGENTFVARAYDAKRTEGRSKTFSIQSNASSNPADVARGLNLHVLAVGIDQYTNSKYNLNYAVADASAFLEKIKAINTGLFSSVTPYFIKNSEATGAKIIETLQRIQSKAGPRDVFVFYYAGHGVMAESGERQFYLVPTDVTQLYGDDAQLKNKAISSQQLLELSKNIPAQKQLFILDACQSAGALQTIAMRGAAEEKAIAQLARSTGTHWLTASGSEQFATEFSELGHGAFTYTLLKGLDGAADTGDANISVNELKAFLESEVPEVTAKYKGTPQYPSSYGYGNDFPVGTLTK